MQLGFVQQFETVARRVQRRRWATALCWLLTALVATVLAAIAVDWLLVSDAPMGRLLLTTLVVTVCGIATAWGRQAVPVPMTPLDVALQLQRRHPEFEGLLASGLEFSGQEGDDPTAGSIELRRAVVLRASLAAQGIDLSAIIPRRPLRRAVVAAATAVVALAVAAILAPHSIKTGLVRVLNPLSDVQWPREHDLTFDGTPPVVAIGGDFRTTLHDRHGRLPPTVEVEFRTQRYGRWKYQRQSYTTAGESLEVTWPNVQQSFEFRARGGDHQSMGWRRVAAAAAPQLVSLEFIVTPPAYTGQPAAPAEAPLRVLKGSQVELKAMVNSPLKSAQLRAAGGKRVALTIAGDGRTISAPPAAWMPKESSEWSVLVATSAGLVATVGGPLEITVFPDAPPVVELTSPVEDLHVVPTARFEATVGARDDLGLHSISLALQPEVGEPKEVESVNVRTDAQAPGSLKAALTHEIELATIDAPIGSTWQLAASARDIAGQTTVAARPVAIRVITQEEFVRRQQRLQTRLSAALERAHSHQQGAHQALLALQEGVDAAHPGGESASSLVAQQRAVTSALSAGFESAARLSDMLVSEYRRNVAAEDASLVEAVRWQADIHALLADRVTPLEAQAASLARLMESSSTAGAPPTESGQLRMLVRGGQEGVMQELERLLGELSSRGEVRRHERAFRQLRSEQLALEEETERIAAEELRDPSQEISREQQRRREQLAGDQRTLAARLATAAAAMKTAADSMVAEQPAEAARLAEAARAAERSPAQAAARQAADEIAAERFGQAAQQQRRSVSELEKIIAQLEQREREAGRAGRLIEELDAELSKLAAAQQELVEEAAQDRGEPAHLAQRQASLRQRAIAQADQIASLPVFAHALRSAAATMASAESELGNEATAADGRAFAADALEQLRQLARAVREQRQQQSAPRPAAPPADPEGNAPQPSANPQAVEALQSAVAQLGLLRALQLDLQERTAELEQLHATGTIDDAALAAESAELAAEQQTLTELVEKLVEAATAPAASAPPEADRPRDDPQE